MQATAPIIQKILHYSPDVSLDAHTALLHQTGLVTHSIEALDPAFPPNALSLYLLTPTFLSAHAEHWRRATADRNGSFAACILVADGATVDDLLADDHIEDVLSPPFSPALLAKKIRNAFQRLQGQFELSRIQGELQERSRELRRVSQIGAMLMSEKDLGRLLEMIVQNSRELTSADAGSLYLVEETAEKTQQLRFKVSQNDSLDLSFSEFVLPLSKNSIAGYVAVTGETLNLPDAYALNDSRAEGFKKFDEKTGYRTKSMLVVPLKDHVDHIIGVIQLINRKRHPEAVLTPENTEAEVYPFEERNHEILQSLAGQAAVSVENNLLYRSIENLFEGFVKASVTAIESRDPTTSGHSNRVAVYTVGLAELVDRTGSGRYRNVGFTREQIKEIRYASLLHDFGKVGVREHVLLKAKKLFPYTLQDIMNRFRYIRKSAETEALQKKVAFLLAHGNTEATAALQAFDRDMEGQIEEIDRFMQVIQEANEPTVLEQENLAQVRELAQRTYVDFDGTEQPLLAPGELFALSVKRGSLTTEERLEIESHVAHSYNFLRQVPWTDDIRGIPDIAHAHHEKLNGTGYPNKLRDLDIPFQAKIMTISDIFDALTARDRPYKRAVPLEKALDILRLEMQDDHIDPDLLELFIDAKIYDLVLSLG